MLEVGGGHLVYWEECGNPNGKPALVLHGGPGSGCSVNQRRNFDAAKYRIVLMDQRGCGRSRPLASEPDADLSANTTHHLIADIEAIRTMLGVDRWLIWGASWGSVLALVYAETYPERVSELLLISMGAGRRMETDLMTSGFAKLLPAAWEDFSFFATRSSDPGNIIDQYADLLFHPDTEVREEAASRWCDWETAIVPTSPRSPRFDIPEFRLTFARLVTHYWRNGSWLNEGQILDNAHRLKGIPGVILQGRLDLSNLSGSPWELLAKWPEAEIEFFDAGHGGDTAMSARIIEVTKRFANSG